MQRIDILWIFSLKKWGPTESLNRQVSFFQNFSVMVSISVERVTCFKIVDGSYNYDMFISFNTNKLLHFLSHKDFILVMDNAWFHHRFDAIKLIISNKIVFKPRPPICHVKSHWIIFWQIKSNYSSIRPLSKTRNEIKNREITFLGSRKNCWEFASL